MKTSWINTQSLTAISAIFLALAGCSDSRKTEQASGTTLEEYRGFKFGTPIWELLSEKKCEFSSEARGSAANRIDYENSSLDEKITELRGKKLTDMSASEVQELMSLAKSEAAAKSVIEKIHAMTDADFLKECYLSSEKLFGVNAIQPITALGKSMRDMCTEALSFDMITCDMKSELNPEKNDFLVFESDSKGRLSSIRFSAGTSASEYKDAQGVVEKLARKSSVKASMLTHTDPPKMGDMVQWSWLNNQVLATWTAMTDYAGELELLYQATGNRLVDSSDELYNQAKRLESDKKIVDNKGLIFKMYSLSAERGHAAAQLAVGNMYKSGEGAEKKNIPAAKMWYLRSADQNNAEAQYQLAKIYDESESPSQKAEALKWYKKAAEQGHGFAQNNLASMYINGEGIPKDISEAYKWYQKSAEQGVDTAQHSLAWIYEKGMLGNTDYAQALKWYQKAADQGYSNAQNNLGIMYEYGYGVPRDIPTAIAWYEKSAAQGNAFAKSNLAKIKPQGK